MASKRSLSVIAALIAVAGLLSAPLAATAAPLPAGVRADPSTPTPIGDGSDDGVAVPGITIDPVIPVPQDGTAPNARYAAVVHTVYFSVVSTTGAAVPATMDIASAQAMVGRMNTYYQAQTDGRISVAFGGYETRNYPQSSCTLSGMYSSYSNVAFGGQFANFAWRNTNQHLMMMTVNPCGSGGIGSVGGGGGLVVTDSGTTGAYADSVGFHEFGHNLGLDHADSSICLNSGTFDDLASQFQLNAGNCPTEQYGDDLDVMGASYNDATPNISAAGRITGGMLTDYISLQAPLTTNTYTINSLSASSGTRALVIQDPVSGDYYFIEYRTNDGYDATSVEFRASNLSSPTCVTVGSYSKCHFDSNQATGAVRVERLVPGGSPQQTSVLAVGHLPNGPTDAIHRDQHLDAGESFTVASGAFTVSVASIGSGSAQITVTPPPVSGPTTSTTSLTSDVATQVYAASARATMTATVAAGSTHPAGTVTFKDGATTLASVPVNVSTGIAAFQPSRLLAAGVHQITATFVPSGTGSTTSTSAVVPLTVKQASSLATVTLAKSSVPRGTTWTATVTVTVTGVVGPTGKVTIYYAGATELAHVTMSASAKGVVTFTLPGFTSAGVRNISAKYAGNVNISANHGPSKALTVT